MANPRENVNSLHSSYPGHSAQASRSPSPSAEEWIDEGIGEEPDAALIDDEISIVAPMPFVLAEFEYLRGCRYLMTSIERTYTTQNQQSLNASQLRDTLAQLEGLSAVVNESFRAIQTRIDQFALSVSQSYEQLQQKCLEQQPPPEERTERPARSPTQCSPPMPCLAGSTLEAMPEPLVYGGPSAEAYAKCMALNTSLRMLLNTVGPLSDAEQEDPFLETYSSEVSQSASQERVQPPTTIGPALEVRTEPLMDGEPEVEPHSSKAGSQSPPHQRVQPPNTVGTTLEIQRGPLVDEEPELESYSSEGSQRASQERVQPPNTVGTALEIQRGPLVDAEPELESYSSEGSQRASQERVQPPNTVGTALEIQQGPLVDEEPELEPYSSEESQSSSQESAAHYPTGPARGRPPSPYPYGPLLNRGLIGFTMEAVVERSMRDEDIDSLDSSYHSPPHPASESSSDTTSTADSGYSSAGSRFSGAMGDIYIYAPRGSSASSSTSSETTSAVPIILPRRDEDEEDMSESVSIDSELLSGKESDYDSDFAPRRMPQKRRRESDSSDTGSSESYHSNTFSGQPSAKKIRH